MDLKPGPWNTFQKKVCMLSFLLSAVCLVFSQPMELAASFQWDAGAADGRC